MAIAIASNLGVHVGGRPLFDDVSFKLERARADDALRPQRRRQVDAAADPRRRARAGSGKPGRWARARASRSTTSGRRATRRSTLARLRALRAPGDDRAGESARAARGANGRRATTTKRTMAAYSSAQARLESRRGLPLARRGAGRAARPRLRAEGIGPRRSRRFSGGELTRASLARVARHAARTCCCSTSRPTTSTSRRWNGSSAT